MGFDISYRSGSMAEDDHLPPHGTPATARIAAACNDRLGAVYSALYAFWSSRVAVHGQGGQVALRRNAYSVVLFDHTVATVVENDFQSSPDQLLDTVLRYHADGGTNYDQALAAAQGVMERHWSTDRYVPPLTDKSNEVTYPHKLAHRHIPLRWRMWCIRRLGAGHVQPGPGSWASQSMYMQNHRRSCLTVAIYRSTQLHLGLLSLPSSVWCSSLPRFRTVHRRIR
jgi:hypothetical protein